MEKVVVLVSSDTLLRNDELNKIKQELEGLEIINADDDFYSLINELETFSFFYEKKLIISINPSFINNFDDSILKEFKSYLENPSDNYLVIALDKLEDNKLTKALKNSAKIIKIQDRDIKNIKEYIKDYFDKLNIIIDNSNIDYIVDNVNIKTIDLELEKLSIYASFDKVINRSDLENLLTKNEDVKIYDLTQAILSKNKTKAFELYNELATTPDDYLRIINNITYKFEELLFCKELIKKGYEKEDIASFFKVSSGKAYYMMKDSKQINLDLINNNLKKLSDLDYKIKSGLINPKIGLELYLLD